MCGINKPCCSCCWFMRVAYGIVPVHPVDRYLLGMQLANTYILDMALSFGLCSAIYNLSSVANLVE